MNGRTKREERIHNRRLRLLEHIEEGVAYCTKHQKPIELGDLDNGCKCYTGNHGRNWCQYFREEDGE